MKRSVLALFVSALVISTPGAGRTDESMKAAAQIPPPPPGKGQVVFFRPWAFKAMALSYAIREGDKVVGKLGNGSYFVLNTEPGSHEFRVVSDTRDQLHMEVEAGETYYVQQNLDIGIAFGKSSLTPSDPADFNKLKLKAKALAE